MKSILLGKTIKQMADGKHKWGKLGCVRCGAHFTKYVEKLRLPEGKLIAIKKAKTDINKFFPCITDEEYSFRKNYKRE